MKKIFRPNGLLAQGTVLFLVLAAGLVCVQANALYGVSWNKQLVQIKTTPVVMGTVSGMQPGELVRGLDFRPATGQLYALGLTGSTGRLYIIDKYTAVATLIGTLNASISGNRFGFDFDPVTDRIRMVSNGGQNFSVNPNDATVVVQTALNPGTPSGIGSAYTNSYKGATSTTLYVYNRFNNTLNTMTPPSSGTLTLVPGPIFQTAVPIDDFDIDPVSGAAVCAFYFGGGAGCIGPLNLTTGAFGPCQLLPANMILDTIAIMPEPTREAKVDFDRDKRTDYSVFRPSTNDWFAQLSSNNGFFAARFGTTGDVLTPGDYDGDERTDVAVWRPTTGDFYVLRSSDGALQSFHFGQNGDEPVVEDFDGDGKTDFAVVRRASGQIAWYSINSLSGAFRATIWGLDTDTIAPGDYDGDGRCDLAVRRGNGTQQATFHILRSTAGYYAVQWGLGADIIVPGDYDADGKADIAVLRAEMQYKWYVLKSSNQSFVAYEFGGPPHVTAPGDYDGDGQTDLTVFSPELGTFYSLRSSSGTFTAVHFGQNGDVPLASYDTR